MSLRKLTLGLLVVLCMVFCTFGLVACSDPVEKTQTSSGGGSGEVIVPDDTTYETGWTKDNDYHWHAATDGTDKVDGKAMHDWKELTENEVIATCLTAGSKEYKCSVCDATKTEEVPQLAHAFSEVETVPATCLASGHTYRKCTNEGCNETEVVTLPALGHDATLATCLEASVCTREGCGEVVAPALGHRYEVAKNNDATCTTPGEAFFVCSNGCGESYSTVTLPALGHNIKWSEVGERVDVKTADLCHKMVYTGACANCSHTETKETEVKEHVFSGKITKEATCVENGVKTLTCACGYSKTEDILKNENSHVWDNGTTVGNITTFKCTVASCNHSKESVVYAEEKATIATSELTQTGEVKLDNTTIALDAGVKETIKGNDTVNISADKLTKKDVGDLGQNSQYVKDGDTVYNLTLEVGGQTVSELGGYVTVTVPYALAEGDDPDHIMIWYINGTELVEIEGTYSNGYVTFKTNHFSYYTVTRLTPAERCNKYGHNLVNYTVEATCSLAGYEMTYCSRCGMVEKKDLPKLEHNFVETTTEPTCTTKGNAHVECKNCHVQYDVEMPALGHNWTTVAQKEATCTEEGSATYTCNNCNETYSVKLAQLPHAFTTEVIEATCVTSGYTHRECRTCGLESNIDYVSALGHNTATKVVAPTCTLEGFTSVYCTVCNEEIEKTDIVKAQGHNMVNGVCSVCGEGCKHEYKLAEKVKATCTEDGYSVFACTKCNSSYRGEMVKATGHKFDFDKCTVCGTPNPSMNNYYLNLINTKIGGSIQITLKDLTYRQSTDKYENDVFVSNTLNGQIKQLDVIEITLSISENGEILGNGVANLTVTTPMNGVEQTMTMGCKLAIVDGKMYAIVESDNKEMVPNLYASVGFDYVLNSMTNGAITYDKLRELVDWYNKDMVAIVDKLLDTNSQTVASVIKFALDNAFVRTEVANGYSYKLNFNAFVRLNETLNNTTISGLVDELLGEGMYNRVPALVRTVLNMTPEQALETAGKYGLDKTDVCLAIDSLSYIMTGEKTDSATMLEQMLSQPTDENGGTVGKMSVAEFIIMNQQLQVTKDEFINGTIEQVNTMLAQYKDLTLYDVLAPMVIGEGATGKDMYAMLSEQLPAIVSMANEMVGFTFNTDAQGNIMSAGVSLNIADLVVSKSIGNSDVIYDENGNIISGNPSSTHYDEKIDVKANVEIVFGAKVTVDNTIVDQFNSAKLKLEKNTVITAYSKNEETEYDNNWGLTHFATRTESEQMLLHTNANGDIIKVVMVRETRHRYIYTVENNLVRCNEDVSLSTEEYQMMPSSPLSIILGYCGDINEYSLSGTRTYTYSYASYEREYDVTTGELVKENLIKDNINNSETTNSGVSVYYNAKTNTFVEYPHSYENLVLNEEKSDVRCGGYYYYECPACGYGTESGIFHLDENYHENKVYELAPGSKTCEDGVIQKTICRSCNEVVDSWTIYHHESSKVGEIDLTQYGAKCGHTINVYRCPCGYYSRTNMPMHVEEFGKYENWGENSESFVVENYNYNGNYAILYRCSVTDCAFNFVTYYEQIKDANCRVMNCQKFVFGVTVDSETGEVTGGTTYEKFGEYYLYNSIGYEHNTQEKTQKVENGTIIETTCADCGLKVKKIENYTEVDEKTNTTTSTSIVTRYKDDATDNTEAYIDVNVDIRVMDANDNILTSTHLYTYYNGAMLDENIQNKQENVTTYTYNELGKIIGSTHEDRRYNTYNGALAEYHRYVYMSVDGRDFITERFEGYEYYDEKGNPSETPQRWTRYEYDYSMGYCSPMITEYMQDGQTTTYPGEKEHYGNGEWVTEPSCTQFGMQKCTYCGELVAYGEPRGHKYQNGVCIVCGLENPNMVDGRVIFEDLSIISETDYVVGYYNREKGKYSFRIEIINLDIAGEDNATMLAPDFAYTDTVTGQQYGFTSGMVSFSVTAIAEEAKKLGITNYMVRVTFVSEDFGDKLDYSITLNAKA